MSPIGTLSVIAVIALSASACAATFKSLDDDRSGGLSRSEAGNRIVRFHDFDADQNGELDAAEYARAEEATRRQRELEAAIARPRSSGSTGGFSRGGGFGS